MASEIKDSLAIELRNITKVYGRGHLAVRAVDAVNLHVERGEIVAIMGPSGSGKTTLLQMLGVLLKPTGGDVLIGGRNIGSLPEKALPGLRLHTFGFIFQTPNLLASLTAAQNIEQVLNLAGKRGHGARERALALLERLGLRERASHLPAELSGGEQQRVAIARALANNPAIILGDEPTANLDSETGHEVMEILRTIAREDGKTVVVVSHDTRIRYVVDRVLWLEDGHLSVRWSDNATIDPVCLMAVEKDRVENVADHDGQTYYFCSVRCREDFEADPLIYKQAPSPP